MTLDSGGYQAKGGAIYPFTAYQDAEIIYIYIYIYMILICEALQVGFRGSLMMEPLQIGRSLPQHSLKLTLDSGGYQAKGGAIYPFTAYQDAEILYINLYIYIYDIDL